jgi:AAA domain
MQDINTYTTTEDYIRLILQGEPKSGKSTLACQFPGAYIIDSDVNLGGPLRYLKEHNLPLPVGYDVLDRNELGADVPMEARYTRFQLLMGAAQKNPDIQTIVIDSATSFSDILLAETQRMQPSVKDGRQLWGFFFTYGKELMARLRLFRKHIIFIAHERLDKLPDGSIAYPVRIAWPGQLGQIMASFFTDVWRTEVKQVGFTPNATYKWVVQTMPSYQYKLGNSLGLPDEFVFDWKLIEEKLKQPQLEVVKHG